MKNFVLAVISGAVIVGCANQPQAQATSQENYLKQAEVQRERQERTVSKAVDQVPKWMTEVPKNATAVYATGTASSSEMSMAIDKAKLIAYGKICMSAGGKVDQRSKVYRADFGDSSAENSEMAVRSLCQQISIAGVETVEVKTVAEGSRFRSYVLVALPVQGNNAMQQRLDQQRAQERAEKQGQDLFKEMDRDKPKTE